MAEIFLASAVGAEGFAKDVVIKVVRPFLASDSQFVQMFIAEARLASKLNHANVVQIFDFGKHDNSYYLAMEYVRGASLWDLRRRCRELTVPFPPTLAAEIVAQVARGLQYAHSLSENGQKMGVVHRDVTPHNVLLSFDGSVKLTDFGIAKATTNHTAPGMLKGKFAYMSPEQSRGERVDARTDLFALGIVLWELVTGGKLFEGDSDLAVLRAVQESLIAPPARLNPDVPQELSDVIMKALARPLEERFQSGFELERALANFVLRNAKSAEDTSVASFLQQMFKTESLDESPPSEPTDSSPNETLPADDEFGLGHTVAKPGLPARTITATPVGPAPGKSITAPAVRRRGAMDDEEAPSVQTEEFAADSPGRPQTEQMPALKRPTSRRFDPLPVQQEPSVLVRPSLQLEAPVVVDRQLSASSEEPVLDVPRRSASLYIVLGILLLGAVLGGGIMFLNGQNEPELPIVVADPIAIPPTEVVIAKEPPPEVVEAPPKTDPIPEPVKEVAKVEPAPVPVPEPVKASPTVVAKRAVGTLAVKAVPFATIVVQGKSYEVTGVKNITVPVGSYEVLLKHPRKQAKEKITVQANQVTTVNFSAD